MKTDRLTTTHVLLALISFGVGATLNILDGPGLMAGVLFGLGLGSGAQATGRLLRQRKLRRFARDTAAVSPVIGVILMVAITVVLAAIVFVLVTRLSDTQDSAPQVSFLKDEEADTLRVVQAPSTLEWSNVVVAGCTAPTTGTVTAGDLLTACIGDVTVTHTPTNALLFQTTFQ